MEAEHRLPNESVDKNTGHILSANCWCNPEVVYVAPRQRISHKTEKPNPPKRPSAVDTGL